MAISANIVDGKVTSTNGLTEKTSTSKDEKYNPYDKEMFLQLLVAEMQYQDPLEPTSNTEYVSELASFSQIEAIQAVQEQMNTIQANSLVGKFVMVLDDNSSTGYTSGKVDYIMNADDTMYLSINDKLYDIKKLDSVVDAEYYEGVIVAETFASAVAKLPKIDQLTLQDESKVKEARDLYDSLTTYQRNFVDSDAVKLLESIEEKLSEMKANYEANHE